MPQWGTPEERFWEKVNRNGPVPVDRPELGPCWSWTGGHKKAGYGQFMVAKKKVIAHRWAWATFVGPIPQDHEIDHLCNNPACVNYERHLEPITLLENRRRRNERKTHCANDHEYTPENTAYQMSDGYPARYCRTCNRDKQRRRRESLRGYVK